METDPNSTELSKETRRDIQRLEESVQRLEIKLARMQIWLAIFILLLQAVATYFRINILDSIGQITQP